jgi:RNA polymerase sigma-70 factor (ECF subfamily)
MSPVQGPREDPRSDAELVDLARSGDRRALDALLRRHHDRVHLLCRRLCRDRGDAEDATQEALIAIVRGLPRYDGRAAFTTWSYRVTTNACLDQLRRRARRPMPSDLGAGDGTGPAPLIEDAAARDAADPERSALAGEDRSQLQAALAALPEEFRVPVVLRDVTDLDYAEIGDLLDLPPGTVRSRISRGRARLAASLPDLRAGTGNQDRRDDVRPAGPT